MLAFAEIRLSSPDTGPSRGYTAFEIVKSEAAVSTNVVISLESSEGDHCVDIFVRPDGTFGIEEFRRDPEDPGEWYSIAQYPNQAFETKEDAVTYAKANIPWLMAKD